VISWFICFPFQTLPNKALEATGYRASLRVLAVNNPLKICFLADLDPHALALAINRNTVLFKLNQSRHRVAESGHGLA